MMGELTFFSELQIKEADNKILVHQSKYFKELLKKFKLDDTKIMSTPMHPTKSLNLKKDSKLVDIIAYRKMIAPLSSTPIA